MAKCFDDGDDDYSERSRRGHRQRNRSRAPSFDDTLHAPGLLPPVPSYTPAPPSMSSAAADHLETGVVRFFDVAKGFGFISPDRPGPDLFVHITAVRQAGLQTLTERQAVTFERGPGRQPGKQAVARLHTAQ